MTSHLVGSDYSDGAMLPNYVNGRLLVAEDLATSQASLRTRDTRIGQAAGAGIVRGLWVTAGSSTLNVTPGLGIAAAGEPVVLSRPITLQLTYDLDPAPHDHADFSCCGPETGPGQASALGEGVLLLVARPSCRLEGQAPLVPPPGSQVPPSCAARWQVAGVEFRAVSVPLGNAVAGQTMTESNRRNLVAHWCFGTEQLGRLGADPFVFDPRYGGLDDLAAEELTEFDVPLAVFSWTGRGITDLDLWSVRRRVTDPDPVPTPWSVSVSDRRVADGQARFLQFQEQAEELVSLGLAEAATAPTYFGLLPPVGFLPVSSLKLREAAENAVRASVIEEVEAAPSMTEVDVYVEKATEWSKRPFVTNAEREKVERFLREEMEKRKKTGTQAQAAAKPSTRAEYFKQLLAVAQATVGYGFDPETFFGELGRSGGLIDWEVAEWSLEQSWKALAVRTGGPPVNPTAMAGPSAEPLFTYYYVIQNLESAGKVSLKDIMKAKKSGQTAHLGANLYVVFIANRRWARESDGPFISYPPGR